MREPLIEHIIIIRSQRISADCRRFRPATILPSAWKKISGGFLSTISVGLGNETRMAISWLTKYISSYNQPN